MHVAPIKPTFKAPGTEHLKLKCDEPLSNFAFNFNLRRYMKANGKCALTVTAPGFKAGAYTRSLFGST